MVHAPITSAVRPHTAIRGVAGVIGVIGITLATGAWTAPPTQTHEAAPAAAAVRQQAVAAGAPAPAPRGPSDDDLSDLSGLGESHLERLASETTRAFGGRDHDDDRDGNDLSRVWERYQDWKSDRNADDEDDPYDRRSDDPYGSESDPYQAYGASRDPYGRKPEPSPTTTPTPRPQPTATKTARPTASPTARPTLPVTGGEVGTAMLVALGLGVGGVALRVAGRRRSHRG